GQGLGFGGRARFGKGLTNNLELGAEASFIRAQAIEFDAAEIERQQGTLFADVATAELAVGIRWTLGVEVWRALERIHPFVGVRAGGLLRVLAGQVLYNSKDMELADPRDELSVLPFVAGTVGLERRFGDHFLAGLAIDVAFGTEYRHVAGNL